MLSNSLLLALTLGAGAQAAMFPKDTTVKMLDPKSWNKVMKINQTSIVAFVAPWCGHCQRMAPEYSKAALGLWPLIPAYAVDCDVEANKRLCQEQRVQGFPTVKLFPRGKSLPPMTHDGERSASALFYFASRRIPQTNNKKIYKVEDIQPWIEERAEKSTQPRALLLTKDKKVPLLWQVLANKYDGQIEFGSHRDRDGKSSVKLGYEAGGKKEPKVFIYAPGSKDGVRYQGINKLEILSKFLDSVLDGTADLTVANKAAAAEEVVITKEEEELNEKQEAQRIALAHGGFANLVDFEAEVKKHGKNYHDTHGYGMMGDEPKEKVKKEGDNASAAPASETPVGETTEAQKVFEAPEPVTQEAESTIPTAKATERDEL